MTACNRCVRGPGRKDEVVDTLIKASEKVVKAHGEELKKHWWEKLWSNTNLLLGDKAVEWVDYYYKTATEAVKEAKSR